NDYRRHLLLDCLEAYATLDEAQARELGALLRTESLFHNVLAPEWGRHNIAWGVSPRIWRCHLAPHPGAAHNPGLCPGLWAAPGCGGEYKRWDSPSWGLRSRLYYAAPPGLLEQALS